MNVGREACVRGARFRHRAGTMLEKWIRPGGILTWVDGGWTFTRRLARCHRMCEGIYLAPHRPPGLVGLFSEGVSLPDLRATFVIDYQNVHLTGVGLFEPHQPAHEHLVHPLHYVSQIMTYRNRNQRPGHPHAVVTKVLVHRGLPSSDIDARAYARISRRRPSGRQTLVSLSSTALCDTSTNGTRLVAR